MKIRNFLLFVMLLAGCGPGSAPGADAGLDVSLDLGADSGGFDSPRDADASVGFDDHTVPRFTTQEAFLAYAGMKQDPAQVKFIFPEILGNEPLGHFEEPGFYDMHDEWAWFRLLNGQPVPGIDVAPVAGLSFATVGEIVTWAKQQTALPVNLEWAGDRLYLAEFYDKSFGASRVFGLGSVLHYAANPKRKLPDELWLFELEYVDNPNEVLVARFFQRVEALMPSDVAPRILWLARSSWQEAVAAKIRASSSPYRDRIVTYDDLVVEGAWDVYNPGISAGIVKIVPKGAYSGASLSENHIATLAEVPDDIPPVAAIVTSVPQTPLAHIGLLARSRGTPNVYLGGAAESQQFDVWETYHQPVILKASAEGVLFREMTQDQWKTYLGLKTPQKLTVPQADLNAIPDVLELDGMGLSLMSQYLPMVGGKAAGFMGLIAEGYEVPKPVLALTVRGYGLHMMSLPIPMQSLLADPEFVADSRVRYLALEGEKAFRKEFGKLPDTLAWLDAFLAKHPGSTTIGAVVAKGGVRNVIEATDIDPEWLAAVTAVLKSRFASLSHQQGIRFRSSSTAEDIEGFNGAGLYDSNTGYLYPEELKDPDKQKKTIAWAIKRTWASYWIFGAFEERRAAGIDHLTGRMAMAVHPTFTDDAELANGVVTLELVRRPTGDVTLLTVNLQKGFLSVTNPPPGSNAQPEVDTVRQEGAGTPVLVRVRDSTEMPAGQYLMSEAELMDMHQRLSGLAQAWLDARNAKWPVPQQNTTLTLDLEIKRMAKGWPAMADGSQAPERLVYKQARPLQDAIRVNLSIQNMPVPRDVLGRTTRVEKRSCDGPDFALDTVEFYTDPGKPWPFDFGRVPFNAYFLFRFHKVPPGLPVAAEKIYPLVHSDAAEIEHPGMAEGGLWTLDLIVGPGGKVGFDGLAIDAAGGWTLVAGAQQFKGSGLACTVQSLVTTPQAYLEGLMQGK